MAEKKTPAEKALDAVDALDAEASGDAAPTIEVRDETFRLVTKVPAIVMLRLSAAGDPKTPVPRQMGAILTFLEHVIVPEDRDRFMTLLEEAEPVIEFDEVNEILTAATEAISGRPTEQ